MFYTVDNNETMSCASTIVSMLCVEGVEGSSINTILFYINGTTLRFTIREFAIISGLNCSDNAADFYFDTDQPNRIIDEYFPGNSPVTKARLAEAFKEKV